MLDDASSQSAVELLSKESARKFIAMSSPVPLKRRRLNESLSTLSKPFVSPLKSSKTDPLPLKQNNNAANLPYQPSVHAHTQKAVPSITTASLKHKPSYFTPVKSTPIRKQATFTTFSKHIDPAEAGAQKALTSLELQVRTVRNEIETLTQAAQLTNSTTDAGLEELAQKWKVAAQTAAEELFSTVKERVCHMDGVAAWRETEKQKYGRDNGFCYFNEEVESNDADCEFDSQGEELPEEEQEYRRAKKRKARKEVEEAADVEENVVERGEEKTKQVWQEEGEDDVSAFAGWLSGWLYLLVQLQIFTMEMMLRSLNIELDVIGWDKAAQRWIT